MDPSRIDEMLRARPDVCQRYGRNQVICQNTSGEQTCDRLPPFELGAESNVVYGDNVELGPGGEPPEEQGVDWSTWYKNWIKIVDDKVFKKLDAHFARDTNSYECLIEYTVYPDGRVTITGGSTSGTYRKGENWGMSARNLLLNLNYSLQNGRFIQPTRLADGSLSPPTQVPLFPQGTAKRSLSRSFTFRKNMGTRGITLGGPPQERSAR
jgi:hypothetical protein